MDEQNKTNNSTVLPPANNDVSTVKPKKKRRSKHDFKDGLGRVYANRHKNGGGWVAATARVDDSVYVGRHAEIYGTARVSGAVKLKGRTKIHGGAVVCDKVQLSGSAVIGGSAKVSDTANIQFNARVTGCAVVMGCSYIGSGCIVSDGAQVIDSRIIDNVFVGGRALVVSSCAGRWFGDSGYTPAHDTTAKDPENNIQIHEFANLQAATLLGSCEISGSVLIHNSQLKLARWAHASNKIKVRDRAVISQSQLYAPLTILGDTTINHTSIRHIWPAGVVGNAIADLADDQKDAFTFTSEKLNGVVISDFDYLKDRSWDIKPDQFLKRAHAGSELGNAILDNNGARKLQRAVVE